MAVQGRSMHLAVVIPVYNEQAVIKKVINSLPKKIRGARKITILAVNDGSTDGSAEEIRKTQANLINMLINSGAGSATATGLAVAKHIGADATITFDGDGQHDPNDIEKVFAPIRAKKADLVIGTRLLHPKGMPWYKKIGNKGLNLITFILAGKWSSDSQSGFKAFSKKALDVIKFDSLGYEFCSEIIIEANKKHLKIVEVPIKTIYSHYSTRKGQSVLNGINIVMKLIFRKITG